MAIHAVITSLSLLLSFALPLMAQPNWVKDLQSEVQQASHPEASAIILYETIGLDFADKIACKMQFRLAVKILQESGERYATVREVISPTRKFKDIEGWHFSASGEKNKLSKKDIVERSRSQVQGYYDEEHVVIATLPDVRPGDWIAFEYAVEEKDWPSLFQEFVFQVQNPVSFAQLQVRLPEGWFLQTNDRNLQPVQFEHDAGSNTYTWTGRHLDYRPEEVYMPPWGYLARRIAMVAYDPGDLDEHFQDWRAVARWGASIFEQEPEPDARIVAKAEELTTGLQTAEEKIAAIAGFVRDEIRYVAVEIGKGRFEPRPAETTLYNRYGDCKDKVTLMRSLLQAADIPSRAVLANSTRFVNAKLPTPFQFNHCIIAMPGSILAPDSPFRDNLAGAWLFFDPTDDSIPLGRLPQALQGGLLLPISAADSGLIRIPYPEPQYYRRARYADLQLLDDGSLYGQVTVMDYFGLASESAYQLKRMTGQERYDRYRAFFDKTIAYVELRNLNVVEHEDSLMVKFDIRAQNYSQRVADMQLLPVNIFRNEKVSALTGTERQHPVWFGQPKLEETHIAVQLPASLTPKLTSIQEARPNEAGEISHDIRFDEGVVYFDSHLRLTGGLLDADSLEVARNFCQSMKAVSEYAIFLTDSGSN